MLTLLTRFNFFMVIEKVHILTYYFLLLSALNLVRVLYCVEVFICSRYQGFLITVTKTKKHFTLLLVPIVSFSRVFMSELECCSFMASDNGSWLEICKHRLFYLFLLV